MNQVEGRSKLIHRVTLWVTAFFYLFASVTLILAAFSLAGKAFYEIYYSVVVAKEISKDILDAITYTVIAIAVCDVGRYLIEEEVEQEKTLRSPSEARKTITRFMVVISIALALEGLVGVFDAGNRDITVVLYPISIVIGSIVVLIGLGIYQRLSVKTETDLLEMNDRSNESKQP